MSQRVTLVQLAKRTQLSVRTLYRLRKRGIFHPCGRFNDRLFAYDLPLCTRKIQAYYQRDY